MRTMHLFAGAGGGLLADLILGNSPVVAVEWDSYACQVLRERAADGWFPVLRAWEGDVRLFDPSEYAGNVGCIHAGFPCTDISVAGSQAGIGKGTHSGLYTEVLRIADVVRPEYIFLENVAAIVTGGGGGWLRTVVGDLAEIGFDAVWCCLSAAEVGAAHKRDRWWLLGYTSGIRRESRGDDNGKHVGAIAAANGQHAEEMANTNKLNDDHRRYGASEIFRKRSETLDIRGCKPVMEDSGCEHGIGRCVGCGKKKKTGACNRIARSCEHAINVSNSGECEEARNSEGRVSQPAMGGMADDVANHMDGWNDIEAQVGRVTNDKQNRADKLKSLENGQVPLQAAVAFTYMWKIMESQR